MAKGAGNKSYCGWETVLYAESTTMAKRGTRELGRPQLIDPVTQLHAQVWGFVRKTMNTPTITSWQGTDNK